MPAHPVTVLRVASRADRAPESAAAALRAVRHGVLDGVSLSVQRGEAVALLGGAGAGKSAVIEILAGFARPREGEVLLDGESAARLPPHRRGVGLVLPEDGPLPGRSVLASVGLGLAPGGAGADAVAAAMNAMRLGGLGERRGESLTPEQRVRAALARALAGRPRLLLLDEPFAGLALAEREAVLEDLRPALPGLACLLATRDAGTALALGGRAVLLQAGQVLQDGPVQEVYDGPVSEAAARLLGPANLLPGRVETVEDGIALVRLEGGLLAEAGMGADTAAVPPGRALLFIRPERIAVAAGGPAEMGEGALPARVAALAWRGDHVRLELELGEPGGSAARLLVHRPAGVPLAGLAPGHPAAVAWQPRHARLLPLPTPT